jgi:hypothetical protein
MSAYIKKSERSQINSLMIHCKSVEKQEPKSKPNQTLAEVRNDKGQSRN